MAAGVAVGEPAAVLHANRVVAVSPVARAEGVTVGQRRREAQAACPSLVLLDHDPARDARAFEPVLQALEVVTPWVEVAQPGGCRFATRGPSRYHGGDATLAALVLTVVAEALGPKVVVAGAAGGGDRRRPLHRPKSPRVARRPVRGRRVRAKVCRSSSIPVRARRSSHPSRCRPWHSSSRSTPSSATCSAASACARSGRSPPCPPATWSIASVRSGRLLHRLASGGDERPPATRRPPPDLAVQAELEPPVQEVGPVAFVAKTLADGLHERLAHDALVCTRVVALAETEHGERQERVWRHEHGFTAAGIAERVRWQLEGWAAGPRPPTGGISLVRLVPDEVVPDHGHQLGFWGGQTQADERALRAVARLSAQVGLEAVAVPEWRGGRGPGEQLVLVPAATAELDEPAARARRVTRRQPFRGPGGCRPRRPPSSWPPRPRPACSTPPALPSASAAAAWPAVSPATLVLDGRSRRVAAWAGPWLADEHWWDRAEHHRRARFQLLTDDGLAWLVRLEGGRWWAEATYD